MEEEIVAKTQEDLVEVLSENIRVIITENPEILEKRFEDDEYVKVKGSTMNALFSVFRFLDAINSDFKSTQNQLKVVTDHLSEVSKVVNTISVTGSEEILRTFKSINDKTNIIG